MYVQQLVGETVLLKVFAVAVVPGSQAPYCVIVTLSSFTPLRGSLDMGLSLFLAC